MKKAIILLATFGIVFHSHAQILKKIQRKLEEKVEKSVDEALDTPKTKTGTRPSSNNENATGNTGGKFEVLTTTDPFLSGNRLIFQDDFSNDVAGKMAKEWQTNSTGKVVEISGAPGKWLQLYPDASYQLDTLLQLPKKFTVEFDLLSRSNQASDLRDITFGFSKNNSTRKYIYGVANETNVYTELKFYYESIITRSNNNNNESRLEFPLSNYANAIMHVSMAIDGERMQIYIDEQKVLDATVLDPNTPKHFFMSTSGFRNNAQAFISNFKIAGF